MEVTEFRASLLELDALAREEYCVSLAEVTTSPGDSDEYRILRVGRLLGVILKKPFAKSIELDTPSAKTGAYHSWDLQPESFNNPEKQNSWEYKALETLRKDPDLTRSLGYEPIDVHDLANGAQTERGFFWYLAMSCRRYLCKDTQLRSQIEREFESAMRTGIDLKNATPEWIVASGGFAIGTILVQNIPSLSSMGAPVIAGLVLILYNVGIDAFCQWASDHEFYHMDFPNPDMD